MVIRFAHSRVAEEARQPSSLRCAPFRGCQTSWQLSSLVFGSWRTSRQLLPLPERHTGVWPRHSRSWISMLETTRSAPSGQGHVWLWPNNGKHGTDAHLPQSRFWKKTPASLHQA